MFQGLWAGSIQNMHPKLGAAVWDHSDFFGGERWQRLMRSLYPISGVVFDSVIPGAKTGLEVRDYHRTVKGTMEDGSRYHALDPRRLLLGACDVLVRKRPPLRAVRPFPHRGPEASVVRGIQGLVRPVRGLDATRPGDLRGFPRVLGLHVPQCPS